MTGDSSSGPVRLRLTALGVPLLLEFDGAHGAAVAELARAAWSRCLSPPDADRDAEQDGDQSETDAVIRVVVDDDPAVVQRARVDGALAGTDPAQVMDNLSPRVTISAIEQRAGDLMMLHAAGIADPETGRTVVLVAPSGTGKTTSARLLTQRWGYVSDETVGIRADRTIAHYPKPLSIRTDGDRFKAQLSPDALGLVVAPEQPTLHRLALLVRDDASPLRIERPTTVQALARLAPETSYLAKIPHPLQVLGDLIETSGGLRVLHYADTEQLVEVVETFLGED